MMLQDMLYQRPIGANIPLCCRALPLSTVVQGQAAATRSKAVLMRKQLARQGSNLFRVQASHEGIGSAQAPAVYGPGKSSRGSGTSAQRQQHSNFNSTASDVGWETKAVQGRIFDEHKRSQKSSISYHRASPGVRHAISALVSSQPNDPIEARKRANPTDAAQPSVLPSFRPTADSAHNTRRALGSPGVDGHSSLRPATALCSTATDRQLSVTQQEAVELAHQEFDLHSPLVNRLAAQAQLAEDADTEQQATISDAAAPADVCVVTTADEARRIVQLIHTKYTGMTFACDTEVMSIDLSKESPCGHGIVTCFSIYGGTTGGKICNFAADSSGPEQDQLWVDTMLGSEDLNKEMFAIFKDFFEDDSIKKVWHNYSFDRHVLRNHGIDCRGFTADTMHMARLWDSSRQGKGYSLESLTSDKNLMADFAATMRSKTGMKTLFGKKNIKKDNTEGKLTILPPVEELQTDPSTRGKWIDYSAYDAKATWQLAQALRKQLMARDCVMDARVQRATGETNMKMMDMYKKYWRPFGLLLTDMEKEGMSVNRPHLKEGEEKAVKDQDEAMKRFRRWASQRVPGAENMNVGSGAQIRQLLFAGVSNQKAEKGTLEHERVFKALNTEGWVDPNSKNKKPKKNIDFSLHSLWGKDAAPVIEPEIFTASGWPAVSTAVLRALAGKPGAAKRVLFEEFGETDLEPSSDDIPVEALIVDDLDSSLDEPVAESRDDDMESVGGEPAEQQKAAVVVATPSQSSSEMDEEANKKGYGKAYAAFGGGREGLEACAASGVLCTSLTQDILLSTLVTASNWPVRLPLLSLFLVDALCELGAIDTLLSNFIRPLQGSEIATTDSHGNLDRIHCSLNINTETGRLSARRPNLQNQPALEKDRYKVRKAFTADLSKGHTLVVADYGQLELRILAHMANCTSMQTAFRLGGDFHSRTALGMYDHIKEAINKGECMLEWEGQGKAPVPLLKEAFASERRKAKVLNFSIAYGKTAHGLSKDWKVSLDEAKQTVDRWYADRPEVRLWQDRQQTQATNQGYVCTLLGRQRQLPDASKRGPGSGPAKGHALRAAINTPVQGSAADVATAAMISIDNCQQLKQLGWKLLLQVHDEVILEGPKESAEEAQRLVLACMEKPFDGQNPLLVELVVDSKIADTWYEAK